MLMISDLRPADGGGYPHPRYPGESRRDRCFARRVSISPREAVVLSALAHHRIVYEIGTGLGVSAAAMRKTAASVLTYDPDPWVAEVIAPRLAGFSIECVTDTPTRDELVSRGVDLMFIDGAHDEDAVERDCRLASVVLQRGGVLLLHDVKAKQVRTGADAAGVRFTTIDTEYGIGIAVQE